MGTGIEGAGDEKLLAGRVVLVTGGSNGIGRDIAIACARHGAAAVLVADLERAPREGGTPTDLVISESIGARSKFVECDVSRSVDLDAVVAEAEAMGGLDVLVNNAGITIGRPIVDLGDADIDRVIDANLKGTLYGCRAAAQVMAPRQRGVIINMSSIAGLVGAPNGGLYGATKGAIRLLTYALAAELGPLGIRVNVLHPGVVDTNMMREAGMSADDAGLLARIPSARVGSTTEIAGAAVFLASDLASYVNGASLAVDGGMATAL